jgi:hypothetical protein
VDAEPVSFALVIAPLALAVLAFQANAAAARLQALDSTCQAGRLEKCLEAGRAHLQANDPEGALGPYAKACSGAIAEGCLGLASRYTGLAQKAHADGDDTAAATHADKGLSLVRQAIRAKPNLVEAAEYEAILCRIRAAAARGKADADAWSGRAREAERRAEALRAVMGPGDSPDLFWRPLPSPKP